MGSRKDWYTFAIFAAISSSGACERVASHENAEHIFPRVNIHNSSTRSHLSGEENRSKNGQLAC
jgi:hypothetical protein